MAPHHAFVDKAVCDLIDRRIPQRVLLVKEPPRHGKSEHLCHWTPPWFLGHFPDRQIIMVGHGERFATKWGRRSRNTFETVAPSVFPTRLDPNKSSAVDWSTTEGGGMLSAGMGSGINGEGAGLLIVDDLIGKEKDAQSETFRNDVWDWFVSTAWTRLAPDGVCVMIGTPWHRDDHMMRMKREFGDEVLEVSLPALAEAGDALGREEGEPLWPERWGKDYLDRQRKLLGPYFWSALYGMRPTSHEEAEWPEEYFDDIFVDELPEAFDLSAIGCDPSKGREKGDYSSIAFAGWCGGRLYIDCDMEKRPSDKIIRDICRMHAKYRPEQVGLEAVSFQELFVPMLARYQREHGFQPIQARGLIDNTPKPIRIRRLSGWLAERQIKFLDTPSNRKVVEQMKDFPLGDHDDGPDSVEMAVRMLNEMASYGRTQTDNVEAF